MIQLLLPTSYHANNINHVVKYMDICIYSKENGKHKFPLYIENFRYTSQWPITTQHNVIALSHLKTNKDTRTQHFNAQDIQQETRLDYMPL